MSGKPSINDLTKQNIEIISQMRHAADLHRTFGERVADDVARIVGSWPFIIVQTVLLVIWVALNVMAWAHRWDPYPFILLNLALSFQAAYASPIIMMSQNRQARLDDRRNQLDLQINLLAEQENTEMLRLLRLLCAKAGISGHGSPLEQQTCLEEMIRQIDDTQKTTPPV